MKYTDKIIRRMLFEWIVKEFEELRLARGGTEDLWLEARQARYATIEGYASPSGRWNGAILIVIWPDRDALVRFHIVDGELRRIDAFTVNDIDENPQTKI